jgi:aminopeptidase N
MRKTVAISALPVLVLLASCAEVAPPAAAVTPAPPSAASSPSAALPPPGPRDDGRLPLTVTPRRYALTLRVDPNQARFSGRTVVQVDVPAPTPYAILHARGLRISSAVAIPADGAPIAAAPSTRVSHDGVDPEELVLTFERTLPAGTAQLEIDYDAAFNGDLAGLYRVQDGDAWYAYTQFEATDARRAFPCFDEPGFKTPWDVTLITPRGLVALANSPEASHEDTADGMVAHHFETSRPMPSYLVAIAVGDFDVVQGQAAPFPIRAITTKGKGGMTGLALEASAALIAKLGEYFDIRYPYSKLDVVAVPDFAAGAMENPGLVTFRDEILLLDPQRATTAMKRDQAQTIAHEFAHQWFGDLVTAQWWDDIWLNEGFATWAEAKMVDAWKPAFGARSEQISNLQHVMDIDALRTARAVREPVHSSSDAMESFDDLTYSKGAAVLRMIESWIGPDTFRRGVQRYVHDHAWQNARAADLFDALDYVSTQKVGELASAFLDHPGVPSVALRLECAGGTGKVELTQSEWRPLGTTGDAARSWTLPVCVATDTQKAKSCFTLGAAPIARDLGARCPTWLYPNADEAGYYRFVLDRAQIMALARGQRALQVVDRVGLVSNAWAAVRQGALEPAVILDLLPSFDGDGNRLVIEQIASVLAEMDRALVRDDDRTAFRKYAAARLAGRKASLGWEGAKHEDDDRALARRDVLSAMGQIAYDGGTLAEAEKYAGKWLKDPSSVPADTASVAVPLASMRAGVSRLEELRAVARAAKTPEDRVLAITSMGMFETADVLRHALDLGLTDEIHLSELRYLFGAALSRPASAPVFYAWQKEHWATLRSRIDAFDSSLLVGAAGTMCTKQDADDARAFLGEGTRGVEGTRRALDQGLEEAMLCAALRDHGADAVAKYLGKR